MLKEKERILVSKIPIFEATEVIYEAIDKRINELVESTVYNCKFIILMGAVLINSDSDMGSYTSTKRFDVLDLSTKNRKNLLSLFK